MATKKRPVTDPHLRILRFVAQHGQRELADHDAAKGAGEFAPAGHGRRLRKVAARTTARVAEAEARRREPGPTGQD